MLCVGPTINLMKTESINSHLRQPEYTSFGCVVYVEMEFSLQSFAAVFIKHLIFLQGRLTPIAEATVVGAMRIKHLIISTCLYFLLKAIHSSNILSLYYVPVFIEMLISTFSCFTCRLHASNDNAARMM